MKKKITLLSAFTLLLGTSFGQIMGAINPETPVAGAVVNTGIAIGPFYHYQAIVNDDPSLSTYSINWWDDMGNWLDSDIRPGYNPDVAYYSNIDAVVVAYEDGGNIFVDDYYLNTLSPVDYVLNTGTNVANGTNPNIDINSPGNGVMCWEDGGDVFACTFNVGTFTPGPIVWIGNGSEPDIVALDTDDEVVITYTQGGQLIIEMYDRWMMTGGVASLLNSSTFGSAGIEYQMPRIASQRNAGFGPVNYYTVVAQDDLGGNMYNVDGFFDTGGGPSGPILINADVNNCGNLAPKPVVTYNLGLVDIAWAQRYAPGCAGAVFPPGGHRDILMAECDYFGTNVLGPTLYLEVNQIQLNFLESATSLNSEYDGNYSVNTSNYNEGIVFNNAGDAFWKKRDPAVPSFKVGETEVASVIKGAAEMQIQVTMNLETDEEMTFVLYDASGRVIDIPQISQEGSNYTLDASQLTDGIYLLNCMVGDQKTVARIPHFTN